MSYVTHDNNLTISLPAVKVIRDIAPTGLNIVWAFYGVIIAKDTPKMEELM